MNDLQRKVGSLEREVDRLKRDIARLERKVKQGDLCPTFIPLSYLCGLQLIIYKTLRRTAVLVVYLPD